MAQRRRGFIRSVLFPAEDHHHAAGRIEFDDHVGTLVRRPDIVR